MTKSRIVLRGLLADLYFFSLIHGLLSCGLFWLYGDSVYTFWTLGLLIPFSGMSFIRFRLHNIALFIACHLALTAWPLLLPGGYARGVVFAAMTMLMIYSFSARLKPNRSLNRSSVLIIVLANLTLAFNLDRLYVNGGAVRLVLIFWVFTAFVSYLIVSQTANVDESIDVLSGAARQPLRTMLRFNNMMLASFLGIVAISSALSPFLPLSAVLEGARLLFVQITRWLARIMNEAELSEPPATEPAGEESMYGDLEAYFGKSEPPAWLTFIYDLLEKLMIAIAVICILAFLIWCAYAIYRRFYSVRRPDGDTREFIGPTVTAGAIGELWNGLRMRLPYFGKSESERIRRAYYRKVRAHIRKGVQVTKTDAPGEIERKISRNEDISALTAHYNGARYGGE